MSEEKELQNELKSTPPRLMPTRKDIDLEPMADDDPRRLKLGWVIKEYGPLDSMPTPPGNHQGTEYSDLYLNGSEASIPKDDATRRRGYTTIDVLPFLVGKPWNNLAINWMKSLRSDNIRVSTGMVNLDAAPWRVTVIIDENKIIKRIYQEVEVGLIGCYHGQHLDLVTADPTYQGEPPRAFFNPEGITKMTL